MWEEIPMQTISRNSVGAPLSRVERILDFLELHHLWGFPLGFIRRDDSDKYEKIPCDMERSAGTPAEPSATR
jgi:hypothetical protein